MFPFTLPVQADSLRAEFNKHNFSRSDFNKAKILSELGISSAVAILGTFYILGEFVEKDVNKGIYLVESAAKRGNKHAIYGLGKLYQEGVHVKKDHKKAFEYFNQIRDSGSHEVFYELGKMYSYGIGVDKDIEVGRELLRQATSKGNTNAKQLLSELK